MLILLMLLAFQDGTTNPQRGLFILERQQLELSPERMGVLIEPEGPDLVFRLSSDLVIPNQAEIHATLVGPSLTAPLTIRQGWNEGRILLDRGLFTKEGIYELQQVRLFNGTTLMAMATPDKAEIQVAEKFVVTEIGVRPLSAAELADLGFVFNENDYMSLNFELKFETQAQEEVITIHVPAVFPKVLGTTYQPRILADPFQPFVMIKPIKVQGGGERGSGSAGQSPGEPKEKQPPIPGLILIPGNFKYLKSHFEVSVITANTAPEGFDVRVNELTATLSLPNPLPTGELPLSIRESLTKPMVNAGADGVEGTADDRASITPGERASTGYVVTGNVPGIHEIEVLVKGELELPQGKEPMTSKAEATIYVRSPEFSVSFEHPDVVAAGEAYDLEVNVTNKGTIDLEAFSMTLDPDRMVGVALNGSHPVQTAALIPRGGQATLVYHLRSLVTGSMAAGYFKAGGQAENRIDLRVGVGSLGERLSPYTLVFPKEFEDHFPAAVVAELKRYAKRALDVSLTESSELPADLMAMSPTVVREFNKTMAQIGATARFGNPERLRDLQLFSLWSDSMGGHEPLDRVRRKILKDQSQPLEQELGRMLGSVLTGVGGTQVVTELAQENTSTKNLLAVLVEGSTPLALKLGNSLGQMMDSDGLRQIPFGTILPLSATRQLVWVSQAQELPVLEITARDGSPQVTVTALYPQLNGLPVLSRGTTEALSGLLRVNWDPATGSMNWGEPGRPTVVIPGDLVPTRPFELVQTRQVAPPDFGNEPDTVDFLGRTHLFRFSTDVDLASLEPLEEHVWINGKPAVDAQLQRDHRTLLVSSRMPLGPYRPIRYELRGVRARDGQELGTLTGSYEGNPFFFGVTVSGQVVDRNGRDLSQARMFLWMMDTASKSQQVDQANPGFRILDETTLNAQGGYSFDFAPMLPFEMNKDRAFFRVAVLLPDGTYEERELTPLGPGQEVQVDFSFLQQGTVEGIVTDTHGQPKAGTDVFVTSQHNPLSRKLTVTDATGYYRVDGIEVGPVLAKAADGGVIGLSAGHFVAPGPLRLNIAIIQYVGTVEGQVTKRVDGVPTPVAGALIGYAHSGSEVMVYDNGMPFTVLGRTDATGHYRMENVPSGIGQLWAWLRDYPVQEQPLSLGPGESRTANFLFTTYREFSASVRGRVVDDRGKPLANTSVSYLADGNRTLFRTSAAGTFQLDHLPLNENINLEFRHDGLQSRTIKRFVETPNLDLGDVVLHDPVSFTGEYLNAAGDPIPYGQIYIGALVPGFEQTHPLTQADYAGRWRYDSVIPGMMRFSGYRPPHIATTIAEGHAGAHIKVKEQPLSALRVKVIDVEENPLVAKLFLKSQKPSPEPATLGVPTLLAHPSVFTNEQGEWLFENLNIGEYEVYAERNGKSTRVAKGTLTPLTENGPPQSEILAFPADLEEANLFGTVFEADGSPAPPNTVVQVTIGDTKGVHHVDAAGNFRFDELTTTNTPVRVGVLAYNPNTGHYANAYLDLRQDLNFRLDLTLKKLGTLRVSVVDGEGLPVSFAGLKVEYEDINYTPPAEGESLVIAYKTVEAQVTPSQQTLEFPRIPAGPFVIRALQGAGFAGLRTYSMPMDGGILDVSVRLEASSSISGAFVNYEANPVPGAEVQLRLGPKLIAQHVTSQDPGSEGQFLFDQLPMRTYRIHATDPGSYLKANLDVITSPYQPNPAVTLQLDPTASLSGYVYYQSAPVANARVLIEGLNEKILTGTDDQGRYHFEYLPLGSYQVTATSAFAQGKVSAHVTLNKSGATQLQDFHFGETLEVEITLLGPDGLPVDNAMTAAYNQAYSQQVGDGGISDSQGTLTLRGLPPGRYQLESFHPTGVSEIWAPFTITASEPRPIKRTFSFPGHGFVQGFVRDSLGEPLTDTVNVNFEYETKNMAVTTDVTGFYRVGLIPTGVDVVVSAFNPLTREQAREVIRLSQHGELLELNLNFRAATEVSGHVRFANGQPTPYAQVSMRDVVTRVVQADQFGFYTMFPVLEGTSTLIGKDPISPRKAARAVTVTQTGGVLNPVTGHDLELGGVSGLTGMVSYSDGQVVRFGTVTLLHEDGRTRHSTAIQGDGRYVFTQVPLGEYTATAYDNTYASWTEPVAVSLGQDSGQVEQDLVFPPSFVMQGRLFNTDRTTHAVEGYVKLWRAQGATYNLIYSGRVNTEGVYRLDHIYPGPYLLEAENSQETASYKRNILISQSMESNDLYLESVSWIEGSLVSSNGSLFGSGQLILTQLGVPHSARLNRDGTFRLTGLAPGPYSLTWYGGPWMTGTVQGTLAAGLNRVPVPAGPTISITGRAILAKLPPAKPWVRLSANGINQTAVLDPSGGWTLDDVPANTDLHLRLHYGSAERVWSLKSFSTSTDIGTHRLDAIPPDLAFAQDGSSVTEIPYRLAFQVFENEVDSAIDPLLTRVWVNGTDISSLFTTTEAEVFAELETFPRGFTLGMNTLVVEVGNTSRALAKKTFHLNLALQGTSVQVRLQDGGLALRGKVNFSGQAPVDTNDQGVAVLKNVPPGTYALEARADHLGLRKAVVVTPALVQEVTLELVPVGAYQGRVLAPDGSPVSGASVLSGEISVESDPSGVYRIDLLPLGHYELSAYAQGGSLFGWLEGPLLTVPGQTLVDQDIQMEGTGLLTGRVFDGDGVTPSAGAQVTLALHNLPASLERKTQTDANGQYRFENVPTRPFTVSALEPVAHRAATAPGHIQTPGETLTLDLLLAPAGSLTAVVVDPQNRPVSGLVVKALSETFSPSATTDATGRFRLEGLPYQPYVLDAESGSLSAYLSLPHEVSVPEQDLGTLELVRDQPPQAVVIVPSPFVASSHPYIQVDMTDDRALAQLDMTYGGVLEGSVSLAISGKTESKQLTTPADVTTPAGLATYALTITDHLGHPTLKTGSFSVVQDQTPPTIQFSQPLENAEIAEGSLFLVKARVTDSQGIATVRLFVDDRLVAERNSFSEQLVVAPSTEVARPVNVRIEATDRLGNGASVSRQIRVMPISSEGGPSVTLLAPIEGMPLPFTDLNLQIAAHAEDPDGLATGIIRLNGVEIYREALSGTSATVKTAIKLTAEQQQQVNHVVEVELLDLGGNRSLVSAQVLPLAGSYETFDATKTLNLAIHNTSQDGKTLVLKGGIHVIDGAHYFEGLYLINGARVQQTTSTVAAPGLTHLNANQLVIDYDCAIDADGRGYPGHPIVNNGTGHGGMGTGGQQTLDQVYGSPYRPSSPGSVRGGGVIRIVTPTLWLAGSIQASDAVDTYKGSGGSIWIQADRCEGFGSVLANGYASTNQLLSGGGGRIAIYGDFHGTVQAYGGKGAGAGSIYTRVADPTQPDGFRDQLRFENPDGPVSDYGTTTLVEKEHLQVVQVTTDDDNGQPMQVLHFSEPLRLDAFLGCQVAKEGDVPGSTVFRQQDVRLWSEPLETFGNIVAGDFVSIGNSPDEVVVVQTGYTFENRPRAPFKVVNGVLTSGTQTITLEPMIASGTIKLAGSFQGTTLPNLDQATYSVDGSLTLDHLQLDAGTLTLTGSLTCQTDLKVASGATIAADSGRSVPMYLTATNMDLAGTITSKGGAEVLFAYQPAHGSLDGRGQGKTYGSLYAPKKHGSSADAGGSIQLNFTTCHLTGRVDSDMKTRASGGSLWLIGQVLTGTGTLSADGETSGGRVAIWVADPDGFSGTVSAYGGLPSATGSSGGPGTVYWKTNRWPLGKLVVAHRGQTTPGITDLPSLGERTLTTAPSGTTLSGTGYPEFQDLVGMFVQFPGQEPVRIANHTTTELEGEVPFPQVAAGSTYQGLYRFDVVEVRGKAHLRSIDPIHATTWDPRDGIIEAPGYVPDNGVYSNGTLELNQDPGVAHLQLDNFNMVVRYPASFEQVTLLNGSTLTYTNPITISGALTLTQSTLTAKVPGPTLGLRAGSVSMTQSTWTIADSDTSTVYPLLAEVAGPMTVDANSTVTTTGQGKGRRTYLNWYGTVYNNQNHGGFGLVSNGLDAQAIGSFADPNFDGNLGGGGIIRIKAADLLVDGHITANSTTGTTSGSAGGSVRLEVTTLRGSGSVEARPLGTGNGGGGRIAVYYDQDRSFLGTLTFDLQFGGASEDWDTLSGAGTLYLKSRQQPHGELIVNQEHSTHTDTSDFYRRHRLTGVTGLPNLNMRTNDADPSPTALSDSSWLVLPPGLAGLYIAYQDGGIEQWAQIRDNTHNKIELDRPVPNLPAGTAIRLVLKLDRLSLNNGAQLHFAGDIEADEIEWGSGPFTSVWANKLTLPNPWVINNRSQRLILDNPDLSAHSVVLNQATLLLDKPLVIDQLDMTASTLSHSESIETGNDKTLLFSNLDLQATRITADATSKVDVSLRRNGPSPNHHGGLGNSTINILTHGNLFQPVSTGRFNPAGGLVRVRAQSIHELDFFADGQNGSGGSIWVDAETLTGAITASARASANGGGGRVAIHSRDATGAQLTTRADGYLSAGTVFLRTNNEPFGTLILDNAGRTRTTSTNNNLTPIPVFTRTTLPSTFRATYAPASNTTQVTIPGLTLGMDYGGYSFQRAPITGTVWPIVSSSDTGSGSSAGATFVLFGDASSLRAGDSVGAALQLSAFQKCSICRTQTDLVVLDAGKPTVGTLQVTGLNQGALSPGQNFEVGFSATDGFAVTGATVTFNGQTLNQNGAGPFVFSLVAPATAGSYPLVAEARDAAGNKGTAERILSSNDTVEPTVTIQEPSFPLALGEQSQLTLVWSVSDNSLVTQAKVTFDGAPIAVHDLDASNQNQVFRDLITLPEVSADRSAVLILRATDLSGNEKDENLTVQILDDTIRPNATIISPTQGASIPSGSTFQLHMETVDNLGLKALTATFNGVSQTTPLGGDTAEQVIQSWTAPNASTPTPYPLTYQLTDLAGNVLPGSIDLTVGANVLGLMSPELYYTFDERDRQMRTIYELRHHADGEAYNDFAFNQPGQVNQAFGFDGVSATLTVFSPPLLGNTGLLSLSLWVKGQDAWQSPATLVKYSGTSSSWRLDLRDGQPVFSATSGDGQTHEVIGNLLPLERWVHLVLTYNQGDARIFVNGQQDKAATLAFGNLIAQSDFQLDVGGSDPYLGLMDELLIFNQHLTPEQVTLLYERTQANEPIDFRPPEEITQLQINQQGSAYALSWTPSADIDQDLASYNVYIDGVQQMVLDKTASSWATPPLQPGTHTFRIRAVDTNQNQSHGVFETLTLKAAGQASTSQAELVEKVFREEAVTLKAFETAGDVVFRGTQVTLLGELSARNIRLERGASINLPQAEKPEFARLSLLALETLSVDATSSIRVDGRFRKAIPDKGSASHGGLATGASSEHLYGSAVLPNDPGSGLEAGAVIHLQATTLLNDGVISARGLNGSSGGSILVQTRDIKGIGLFDASGGSSTPDPQLQGGGGRIALHGTAQSLFLGSVTCGEAPYWGTVVLADPKQEGIYLGHIWPVPERGDQTLVQLPHLPVLDPQLFKEPLRNEQGSLLDLPTQPHLEAGVGLWLMDEVGKTYRVLSWVPASPRRGFLQLQGVLGHHPESLRWLIRQNQEGQPPVWPQTIYTEKAP